MAAIDVLSRGKNDDTALFELLQTVSSTPNLSVLLGMHQDSAGIRVLRTDAQGRLLVNNGTGRLQVVNTVLADVSQQVVTGAGVYRKCVFYAQNANLNLSFRLDNLTVTPEITVVPNVPLTVEAVFLAVLARNTVAGVPSTLQAVIQSDLLAGQ